jgi:hypothetical protein
MQAFTRIAVPKYLITWEQVNNSKEEFFNCAWLTHDKQGKTLPA